MALPLREGGRYRQASLDGIARLRTVLEEGADPGEPVIAEVERPGTLDQLTVKVEVLPELLSDRMDRMQRLKDRIGKESLTVAGIRANVELAAPRTLERFTGKAKRVVDKRGQA